MSSPQRLGLHKAWRSSRPASVQLTVVTAATLTRLDALRAQCNSWAGPLVAAVYVGLLLEGEEGGAGAGQGAPLELPRRQLDILKEAEDAVEKEFQE